MNLLAWIVLRGGLLALMWLGFFQGIEGAQNIALFLTWTLSVTGLIASVSVFGLGKDVLPLLDGEFPAESQEQDDPNANAFDDLRASGGLIEAMPAESEKRNGLGLPVPEWGNAVATAVIITMWIWLGYFVTAFLYTVACASSKLAREMIRDMRAEDRE